MIMLAEVGVQLLRRDATVTIKQCIVTTGDYLFAGLDLGRMTSNYLGNSLAVSRDLNGDFTVDVVVGAYGTGGSSLSYPGAVYIAHVRPGHGVGELKK